MPNRKMKKASVREKIFLKKPFKLFGVIEKLLTPLHKQINKT